MSPLSKFPDFRQTHLFDNGYGASVVRNAISYGGLMGMFEVAVLRDGEICYDTPITSDVIGFLKEADVKALLDRIRALVDETLVCLSVPDDLPRVGFEVGGRYPAVVSPGECLTVVDSNGRIHRLDNNSLHSHFCTLADLRSGRILNVLG
jgi:hypothetical protein